jgi:hypothetical protein
MRGVEPWLAVAQVDAAEGLREVVLDQDLAEALATGDLGVVDAAREHLPAHRGELVEEGILDVGRARGHRSWASGLQETGDANAAGEQVLHHAGLEQTELAETDRFRSESRFEGIEECDDPFLFIKARHKQGHVAHVGSD